MAKLKLFAALREAAGTGEAEIDAVTVGGLLRKASLLYGADFSSQLPVATVALNGRELAREFSADVAVGPGDEVALLPPVSGGSDPVSGGSGPMSDRDASRASFALTSALAAGTIICAWISAVLLASFLTLIASAATFVWARRLGGRDSQLGTLAAVWAAGSFPLWLLAQGESGLLWAGTSAVLLVGVCLLRAGPVGAIGTAGALIWLPLMIGFGLSYAVLIRQEVPGPKLLASAGLILVAYKGSGVVASHFSPGGTGDGRGKNGTSLSMGLAGVAAAETAAMLCLLFLEEPFTAGPLATLGLIVALAAIIGESAGRMIFAQSPNDRRLLLSVVALDSWLIALPAFFYGFRLYLT